MSGPCTLPVSELLRRLYYLADSIETTRAISDRLHQDGISDWNFHVLAKNPSGLYTHHIQSALPHHHKDFIRTGEIHAVYGAILACMASTLVLILDLWSELASWFDVGLFVVIGALLGGLNGIRVGMKRNNHRLASFEEDIEVGHFLIMVDVRKQDKAKIRELMNMEFGGVAYRGNDSTFVRPFKSNDRVYPRAIPPTRSTPVRVDEQIID